MTDQAVLREPDRLYETHHFFAVDGGAFRVLLE